MHINEIKERFYKVASAVTLALPVLFWTLVIYAFDEPLIAGLTVAAALIHESGHLLYAFISGWEGSFRGALTGFRLQKLKHLCYRDEILLYLSGPLFNVLAALIILPYSTRNYYALLFIALNLATAVSNLLPIRGQDGYGVLRTVLDMKCAGSSAHGLLNGASFFFTSFLSLLSLYLMQKCNGGYWIYAIFILSLFSEMGRTLD